MNQYKIFGFLHRKRLVLRDRIISGTSVYLHSREHCSLLRVLVIWVTQSPCPCSPPQGRLQPLRGCKKKSKGLPSSNALTLKLTPFLHLQVFLELNQFPEKQWLENQFAKWLIHLLTNVPNLSNWILYTIWLLYNLTGVFSCFNRNIFNIIVSFLMMHKEILWSNAISALPHGNFSVYTTIYVELF